MCTKRDMMNINKPVTMTQSARSDTGFAGVGRWIALASELPCSVIVFLFIGQLLASQWFGQQAAMIGALIGVLVGFAFGVYSVFVTIRHFERIDQAAADKPRHYMPSREEIFEEHDWSSKVSDE